MQTLNKSVYQNGNGKVKLEVDLEKPVSGELVSDIVHALKSVKGYGSIEIYVQDFNVTRITVRNIKKTRHVLAE